AAAESSRGFAQGPRQAAQQFGVEPQVRIERGDAAQAYLLNGRLAADATTRRREKVSPGPFQVERGFVFELNLDHVAVVTFVSADAVFELENLFGAAEEPFGVEEARGQFEVVAGGAHGHGERVRPSADLQGLLAAQIVLEAAYLSFLPFPTLGEIDAARALRHVLLLSGGAPCGRRLGIGNRFHHGIVTSHAAQNKLTTLFRQGPYMQVTCPAGLLGVSYSPSPVPRGIGEGLLAHPLQEWPGRSW